VTQRFALQSLVLETHAEALPFYERCGFQVTSLGEKYPGTAGRERNNALLAACLCGFFNGLRRNLDLPSLRQIGGIWTVFS
jgi:hypothetical protein